MSCGPQDMGHINPPPHGLAIWIMDDGTWQGSGVRIATDSFSKADCMRICDVLKSKFGLVASVIKVGFLKDGSQAYNVYIQAEFQETLRNLVKPFFDPSMLYKLGF